MFNTKVYSIYSSLWPVYFLNTSRSLYSAPVYFINLVFSSIRFLFFLVQDVYQFFNPNFPLRLVMKMMKKLGVVLRTVIVDLNFRPMMTIILSSQPNSHFQRPL